MASDLHSCHACCCTWGSSPSGHCFGAARCRPLPLRPRAFVSAVSLSPRCCRSAAAAAFAFAVAAAVAAAAASALLCLRSSCPQWRAWPDSAFTPLNVREHLVHW